jgi:uncharacterized Zn finger protein
MARGYYRGWAPYVPVAERRKTAEREIKKLRKNGRTVDPVTIEGRTIAKTFWGNAWCDNLENYRDFENRLPRGRTYVRNGTVVDLQISALEIKALVSGSSIYNVTVAIKALAPTLWRSVCKDCAGGIDSLVELLQGRFSKAVMERLCRQDKGLFPKSSEIRFTCSCPDGAIMCKHVAAVLYGVGARLDERPALLFRLRAVDENDLVGSLDEALPFSDRPLDAGKTLETEDISALFGLDLEAPDDPVAARDVATPGAKSAKRIQRKRPVKNVAARPIPANPEADTGIAKPSVVSNTPSAKRTSKSLKAGKAINVRKSGDRKPRATSGSVNVAKKQKESKPEIQLTPDGFVKWWK